MRWGEGQWREGFTWKAGHSFILDRSTGLSPSNGHFPSLNAGHSDNRSTCTPCFSFSCIYMGVYGDVKSRDAKGKGCKEQGCLVKYLIGAPSTFLQ